MSLGGALFCLPHCPPVCLSVCSCISPTSNPPVHYLPACLVSRLARPHLSIHQPNFPLRFPSPARLLVQPSFQPSGGPSIWGRTLREEDQRVTAGVGGHRLGPRALPLCPAQSSSSSQLLPETCSCRQPPR